MAFRNCSWRITYFAVIAVATGLAGPVFASAAYDNPHTAEGWAWALIERGKPADFNIRCNTPTRAPMTRRDGKTPVAGSTRIF